MGSGMAVQPQQQQQAYEGYPEPEGQPQQQQPLYNHPVLQIDPGQQPVYNQSGWQMNPGQQPVYNQPVLQMGPGPQPVYNQQGLNMAYNLQQMAYTNPAMTMAMQAQAQAVMPAEPMPMPPSLLGCPPGLEYLTQLDELLVQQQLELFELFTNWECANNYRIKNNQGQQVYISGEESDNIQRQCCGPGRGFVMHITDNNGEEVIRVSREFKCCASCCPGCTTCCRCCIFCAQEVVIEAPVGEIVGRVTQQASCMAPKFDVVDASDIPVMKIEGPVCILQGACCANDIEFLLISPDGEQVGKISKLWSGYVRTAFSQADNFGISFPMDLDVKAKAVMIGAVFLIDFIYFERSKIKCHHSRGNHRSRSSRRRSRSSRRRRRRRR